MHIRPARTDEAAQLTDLCTRSKAAWGYDAALMEASRAALTVTPERIEYGGCFVADDGTGAVLGVAAIIPDGDDMELDLLFVEPGLMRGGVGRVLLERAAQEARSRGAKRLTILADVNAAAFYERCGAARDGEAPSDAVPGRILPLLEIKL
jgi:N-acetylglutamate synthase-like GNAT family acetyltransferase